VSQVFVRVVAGPVLSLLTPLANGCTGCIVHVSCRNDVSRAYRESFEMYRHRAVNFRRLTTPGGGLALATHTPMYSSRSLDERRPPCSERSVATALSLARSRSCIAALLFLLVRLRPSVSPSGPNVLSAAGPGTVPDRTGLEGRDAWLPAGGADTSSSACRHASSDMCTNEDEATISDRRPITTCCNAGRRR